MILQRITVRYKLGKRDEGAALVKAEYERAAKKGLLLSGARFLKPWRDDQLGEGEFVFESHAQAEEIWGKWGNDPESAAFLSAWLPLVEEGNKTEYFTIA
jgi:hypothetical protein